MPERKENIVVKDLQGVYSVEDVIIKFQQSRRNAETRGYVKCIIDKLAEQRAIDSEKKNVPSGDVGWVRVKNLFDDLVGKSIPNQTTFYRLLNDLFDAKLIEKRVKEMPGEKGRKPTYYRTPMAYRSSAFMSREELDRAYHDEMMLNWFRVLDILSAAELLYQCGYNDPVKAIKERSKETLKEYKKAGKPSPSQSDVVALGMASEYGTDLKKSDFKEYFS